MSLDFSLIEEATQYSLNKLSSLGVAQEKLYLVEDFLHPKLVAKLVNYVENCTDWKAASGYKETYRYQTNWEADTALEEVHIVFDCLTQHLSVMFDRVVYFHGVNLWKDVEGYSISRHTDNPVIDLAIQLYLSSGPVELGTTFEHNGETQAKYQQNCGYIADNNNGLYHSLKTKVPHDHVRYSVYAIWSQEPKK